MSIMQDEKYIVISDGEEQYIYHQTIHSKLGEIYKLSNTVIQNEELI